MKTSFLVLIALTVAISGFTDVKSIVQEDEVEKFDDYVITATLDLDDFEKTLDLDRDMHIPSENSGNHQEFGELNAKNSNSEAYIVDLFGGDVTKGTTTIAGSSIYVYENSSSAFNALKNHRNNINYDIATLHTAENTPEGFVEEVEVTFGNNITTVYRQRKNVVFSVVIGNYGEFRTDEAKKLVQELENRIEEKQKIAQERSS